MTYQTTSVRLADKAKSSVKTASYTPQKTSRNRYVLGPRDIEMEIDWEYETDDGDLFGFVAQVYVDKGTPDEGPAPWEAGEGAQIMHVISIEVAQPERTPTVDEVTEIIAWLEEESEGPLVEWVQKQIDDERDELMARRFPRMRPRDYRSPF